MINILRLITVLANVIVLIYAENVENDTETFYSEASSFSSSYASSSSFENRSSTFVGQGNQGNNNADCQTEEPTLKPQPLCGPNEVEDGCINGGCGRRNCSQLNQPQLCIDVIAEYCIKGCRCKDNFLRDDNGVCVPITECPIPDCGENKVFDFCPAYCQPDCDVDEKVILCQAPPQPGDKECNPSCRCADNLYKTKDGNCVPKEKCNTPSLQCKNPNEVYDECPKTCPPETCMAIWARFKCDSKPTPCKPACRCKPGMYRNKIGECITTDECLMCTRPHEYFSCGGACDNVCDRISRENQTNCPVQNIVCNKKCYCEKGYARDYNNDCIPIADCPPECKENERYVKNINEFCKAQTCAELGNNLECFQEGYDNSGPPGCVCEDGYVRNNDGICIPANECPSCGGDRNATTGCGTFCTTCSNYEQKDQIACIQSCQLNGCACRENYVYDENIKKCVLPENCTPQCSIDEEYYNNTKAICRAKKCSDLGFPLACLQANYNSSDGKPGCLCKEGYVRNKNGVCVDAKECPSCGGDQNATTGCGIFCKSCSNYKKGPAICQALCKVNGCDCKAKYVYDRKNKQCVLPENCP